MSDVGRYRKLYARLWRHPGFAALSEGEKVLALYLLTGPQTNRLGLYCLSVATAAEDLGTLPQTLSKRLVTVCQTFGWLFDKRSRVFYVPSWFKWNPPENANVVKGSLKDLNEIPPCGLIDAFARNLETIPDTLRETFIEGLQQRLPKGMPNQEPYPYPDAGTGKQEPEPSARKRAAAEKGRTRPDLLGVAKKTFELNSNNKPIAEQYDAFVQTATSMGVRDFSKDEAMEAINAALLERRAS